MKYTIRQETNQPFNTNANPNQRNNISNITDEMKYTIRQETNQPFNTNANPNQRNNISNITDEMKYTVRQETNQPFNTNISSIQQNSISSLLDEMKGTIKQDTLIENYIPMVGTSQTMKNTTYLQDDVKNTLRQETTIKDYIGSATNSNINYLIDRTNVEHMETSDGREVIAKRVVPTWKGIAETPSKELVNAELKNAVTYEDVINIPNKSRNTNRNNFIYELNKNDVQQLQPIFDNSFIEIMGNTLKNNCLINNLVYKSNNNNNCSGADNLFINNRS
jgi:hypothetical protein